MVRRLVGTAAHGENSGLSVQRQATKEYFRFFHAAFSLLVHPGNDGCSALAAGVSTSPRADAVSAMCLLVCSLVVMAACPRGIAQGGAAGRGQMCQIGMLTKQQKQVLFVHHVGVFL